jgi:hypothetical protein
MRVFAISDLHLALSEDKPMEIFGSGWDDYMNRIQYNWREKVNAEDLVLLPGDLSWATYLDKANLDFSYIEELPGRKIISKGNHDYWWSTHSKLNEFKIRNGLNSITFLHNNACFFEDLVITGSRGWKNPEDEGFSPEDYKIYNREIERLKLSLKHTDGFQGDIIAMLHYPPFSSKGKSTGFTDILKEFGVKICIYGHFHGKSCNYAIECEHEGIRYHLVSADHLKFVPLLLGEW